MSTPSNGEFQDLDVCGNLVTRNLTSLGNNFLDNGNNYLGSDTALNIVRGINFSGYCQGP